VTYRSDSPDLEEVIRAWVDARARAMHVAMPGRVQSYDPATQRATVLPMVRHEVPQSDGSSAYEDLPPLPEIPVLQPRGGAFFLHLPVAVGDTVLLVFQDVATGSFEASDGSSPVYPGDLRRHGLSSAVAIPGYAVHARALESVSGSPSDLLLGKDDGTRVAIRPTGEVVVTQGATTVLEIDASGKTIVAGGADFVALAALVKGNLDALKTIFNTWVVAPNDGGGALKALLAGWTVAEVKATKLKAT